MDIRNMSTASTKGYRMHKGMTISEAMHFIADRLGLSVREDFGGPSVHMDMEPGWALDVRLDVVGHMFMAEDGSKRYRVEATVNGCAARRSPAQARAYARLFTELADMACLVEAIVGDLTFKAEE